MPQLASKVEIMQARVTAIIVAHNGGAHLSRTLEALQSQTRQPDSVILLDCGSTDDTVKLLSAVKADHFLQESRRLSFGTAITRALGVIAPPGSEKEWLWLLSHDTAPEPNALAELLAAVEVNPSVAVAGPKHMEWDAPDFISSFGESVTQFGARFPLVERELDQAQHDRTSDVLGVAAAGMLVRHTVWNELSGFDPGLPTADNALDFSLRVRLAGHRVIAVPSAKVVVAGDGISDLGTPRRASQRRKQQSIRRAAQLHRRLVYTPGWALVFQWLFLVPLACVRGLIQLIRKQPGAVFGELTAAFRAAFSGRIARARSTLRKTKKVRWSAIAPLRVSGAEVKRRNALQRELFLSRTRGKRRELHFVSSGGAATVVCAALIGLVAFFPLWGAKALVGGSLLPLSLHPAELWAQVGYGWRDLGLGFVGASDPFAYLLAIFGSLSAWAPSASLVALYFLAFPLAACGAWFATARLTERSWLRVFGALLWLFAPPFLSALSAGQVGAIIAHILLPWLVVAVLAALKSWSAAAMAAVLFAVIVAAAPSLWPAFLLLWLVAAALSRRALFRLIALPLPAAVLFVPLCVQQWLRATPLAVFADPGVPNAQSVPQLSDLLLGLPTTGLAGWPTWLTGTEIADSTIQMILAICVASIAVCALSALFMPHFGKALIVTVVILLGLATALGATLLQVSSTGSRLVTVWAGSGLSLYWLGLLAGSVLFLSAIPRFTMLPAVVMTTVIAVLGAPLLGSVLAGTATIKSSDGVLVPALVNAEAAKTPRVGTLVVSPLGDGGITFSVLHGSGATLDQQSTLAATQFSSNPARDEFATLVANLASKSGDDPVDQLTERGVEFIVLSPISSENKTAEADAVRARFVTACDSNPALTPVGETAVGTLWQLSKSPGISSLPQASPTNTGTPLGFVILIIQGIIFGFLLLLALPAGRLEKHGEFVVEGEDHVTR